MSAPQPTVQMGKLRPSKEKQLAQAAQCDLAEPDLEPAFHISGQHLPLDSSFQMFLKVDLTPR